jgi:hypothetical protein
MNMFDDLIAVYKIGDLYWLIKDAFFALGEDGVETFKSCIILNDAIIFIFKIKF